MSESLGKKVVVAIIGAAAGAVITGGFSIYLSNKTEDQMRLDTQNAIVEVLADEFGDITRNMKFDEAIGQMKIDINELKKEKENLLLENENLEKENTQLRSLPKVEYNSISIVKNGLKTEENIDKGWVTIDDRNYYSEDSVNSLLESKVLLDEETSTLFYDTTGKSDPKETRVKLEDTKILYDGARITVCDGSTPSFFSIGSKTYNTGFILETSEFYGYGNALFDLEKKYSKIEFDVGRINDTPKGDVILRTYFSKDQNDVMSFYKDYELSADTGLNHIEIDLNHYSGMKFELVFVNDHTSYGFTNIVLEY